MSRQISVLIFPEFQLLDAAGPIAAFEAAGGYQLRVISAAAGTVRSSSGVSWLAEGLPRGAGDTLMVAGGEGVDAACRNEEILRFLRRASRQWERVSSVCSGSLLLAAGGLLDGRAATTHWSRTGQFQRQFPQVRLNAERIFVQDGPIWTSAGVTAGIDLALAIIGDDFGAARARAVAQELVVYYKRPGGQSQFSALLSVQGDRNRFDPVLEHVRSNLRAYLYKATRNRALEVTRRDGLFRRWADRTAREQEHDQAARLAPTPDEQLEQDERMAALQGAIDALPERRRMVLLLRWRDGLRNDEVADVMGISVKTVENQITQALRVLREQLFEHRD